MNSTEYLNTVVDDMVDIFTANIEDEEITPFGMSQLADAFGSTPIELRAYIYRAFVQSLNDKGYGHKFCCFMGEC